MKKTVFLNGKFMKSDEAKISALDPGFLSGLGLFETMRAYQGKVVYFAAHLKRIKKSSRLLGIKFPYTLRQLKKIIQKTIILNQLKDAYVRLTIWPAKNGTAFFIIAKKYQPYPLKKYKQGFSVCVARLRQNADSFLARIKTTNRLLYQLSLAEAKKKGFDEAIILNQYGYIAEGARSNIFLVKDNSLFTPSLQCGCLEGITRRVVLDLAKNYGIKIYEGKFTFRDLATADEAFFTNSLIGIMPLKNKCAGITRFFIKKYRCLLK